MTTPMIATKMNSPAIAGIKYKSVAEGGSVVCGVVVAWDSSTITAVSANDP